MRIELRFEPRFLQVQTLQWELVCSTFLLKMGVMVDAILGQKKKA